jgi:hypothetical protein
MHIPDFSPETYLQLNPDVNDKKYWMLRPLEHYLKYGKKENRIYVFSPELYLQLNPDVNDKKYWRLRPLEHYLKYGIKEQRRCQYPIIIFDTYHGLCNQMADINSGINFCIIHNIKFSFRFCSFRNNNNLTVFYNEKFENLFDISFLEKYNNLYVNYDTLNLNHENTYNFNGLKATQLFTHNYLNEIINIKKEFIVFKQFWTVYDFKNIIDNVSRSILPSQRILNEYNKIKHKIINNNEQYNFLHYRYENDFIKHFKCSVDDLKNVILNTKTKFKNPNLKFYIATSNIKQIINLDDPELRDIILTKDENELTDYNFEELAFIDYMFGLHSNEVFGHSKSSFSHTLNVLKNTSNFYI